MEIDRRAAQAAVAFTGEGEAVDALKDLYAFLPLHKYIHVPTNALWPAASVDGNTPLSVWPMKGKKAVKPSDWLDEHKPVHQLTWSPAEPKIITDRVVDGGGWVPAPGNVVLNQYRPPNQREGDPSKAGLWRDLLACLYPQEAGHLELWFAHRVQRPGEKINHAIVLGGTQGIGKDSLLEPIREAVGDWNMSEVSPEVLMEPFNPHVKSVIIRVSEARDLGEVDKFSLYERIKTLTANPPATLRVNEKYVPAYHVFNLCSIIYTTNNELDCLYLPPEDRRHFVAWSEELKENFEPDFWVKYYRWLHAEGHGHVAAYLRSLDLSTFDPKAPPPKTAAFKRLVQSNRPDGDSELADAIDHLGDNVKALTVAMILDAAEAKQMQGIVLDLTDRKSRRSTPHRLQRAGFVVVPNKDAPKDGYWVVAGRRQAIYARRELSERERYAAAESLARIARAAAR